MNGQTIINATEIETVFREYCDESKIEFSKNKFTEFLKFLEIDFYDWVRDNLKHF